LGSDGDDDGPLSDGTAAAAAPLDVSRRSSGGSLAPVQSAISRATWRVKMNAAQSSAPAHRQTSKSVVKMQKKTQSIQARVLQILTRVQGKSSAPGFQIYTCNRYSQNF